MFRLFKFENGKHYYWQAWNLTDKTGIVQWGIVGQSSHCKKLKSGFFKHYKKKINAELKVKLGEGFTLIDQLHLQNLGIRLIQSTSSLSETVKIRSKLTQELEDYLKHFGLGYLDYTNPQNSDIMICCKVIDLTIARKFIGEFIAQSEFKDQVDFIEL